MNAETVRQPRTPSEHPCMQLALSIRHTTGSVFMEQATFVEHARITQAAIQILRGLVLELQLQQAICSQIRLFTVALDIPRGEDYQRDTKFLDTSHTCR